MTTLACATLSVSEAGSPGSVGDCCARLRNLLRYPCEMHSGYTSETERNTSALRSPIDQMAQPMPVALLQAVKSP